MDNTLINADCDVTWKNYCVKYGLAPADALKEADRFFEQYNAGALDVEAFLEFQLREFAGHTPEEMAGHTRKHFEEFILPEYYRKAGEKVKNILQKGFPVAILTSTNNAIARPVADFFGIRTVLGTILEVKDGVYTGRLEGTYGVGTGKIAPATAFAGEHGGTLAEVEYYGDSINDRYILEAVGFPVAANPSPALKALAEKNNWRIIYFGE